MDYLPRCNFFKEINLLPPVDSVTVGNLLSSVPSPMSMEQVLASAEDFSTRD
jgi:hypothetical protein